MSGHATINVHRIPMEIAASSRHGSRDSAIDSIRGLAILMVIGIHSLQQPLGALETMIDAALRPAVPLFLFVSGYLTGRSGRVRLVKRMQATLVPYTIAFAVAYIYMAAHNPAMDHRPLVGLARYGLGYVLVYYYIPIYIGCTALLWAIYTLAASAEQPARLILALAIAAMFGLIAGNYLDPLLLQHGFSASFVEEVRLRNIPFWFFFMAIGAIVGIVRIKTELVRPLPWIAACAVIAYAIYAAVRVFDIGDAAPYDSSAFLLYAILLALTLLARDGRSAFLAYAGSGSYFIYLWHIFIVMALRDHADLAQLGGVAAALTTYIVAAATSLAALAAIRQLLPTRFAKWLGA